MISGRAPGASAGRTLRRAASLAWQRRFAEQIRLLAPEVYRFRQSVRFHLLLGVACLRIGDSRAARSFLLRAEQLAPDDVDVRLALCALYARDGDVDRALRGWLAVLDADPANRSAKRGLAILRAGTPAELRRIAGSNDVEPLLAARPGPAFRWRRKVTEWGRAT